MTNATSLSKSSLISTPKRPPFTSQYSEETEYLQQVKRIII